MLFNQQELPVLATTRLKLNYAGLSCFTELPVKKNPETHFHPLRTSAPGRSNYMAKWDFLPLLEGRRVICMLNSSKEGKRRLSNGMRN